MVANRVDIEVEFRRAGVLDGPEFGNHRVGFSGRHDVTFRSSFGEHILTVHNLSCSEPSRNGLLQNRNAGPAARRGMR